jgi:transcriptional regulator with XRE-family HTH domain
MTGADLVRIARLRAGISQRELARRVNRHQSAIARWESGRVAPSFETLRTLIRACGFELTYGLANADDSYVSHIDDALRRSPEERVDDAVHRQRVVWEIQRAAGVR